jgi:tetratricopeptide (TPR) repeat protein
MIKRMLALAGAFMMAGIVFAAADQAAAQGPKPKSKGEQDALMKVQTAAQSNDPKATLDAINNVLENFTDTEYKPMLLDMAVQAAQQAGDYGETVVWGERAIQADPSDIQARVLLAETIAANTHPTDLDKDKSIQKITDYSNQALDLLGKNPAPQGGVPADKWPAFKSHLTAQAHDALGQANALNKKYPEAIKEFQTGIEADPADPLVAARLTKIYNEAHQYDQAIATADKILAMKDCPAADNEPCLSPQIKSYVTAQKNVATKLKGSAAPAASTAPSTTPAPAPTTK